MNYICFYCAVFTMTSAFRLLLREDVNAGTFLGALIGTLVFRGVTILLNTKSKP